MNQDANVTRRRRWRQIVVVSVALSVLLAALLVRGAFSMRSLLGLDSPGDALTLYALSTLTFLCFVALTLVLARYLIKLARERREGQLGSQFKTRMLVGSIALTLLPTVMLFVFSFWLIDSSLAQVFVQPTEQIVNSTQAILRQYEDQEVADLQALARTLVRGQALRRLDEGDLAKLREQLDREARGQRLSTARLLTSHDDLRIDGTDSELEPVYAAELQAARTAVSGGETFTAIARSHDRVAIFSIVGVPIPTRTGSAARGLVLVRRFPAQLAEQFRAIEEQHQYAREYLKEQAGVRTRYVFTLSLLTLMVIFVAVWVALFVSRSVTQPIQALVQATAQVSQGNLDYHIDCEAEGELAILVDSFNAMARQLQENRTRLIEAALELERSNRALDERRAYVETVIASLSTGVVSFDKDGSVSTVNAAATRLLGLRDGARRRMDSLPAEFGQLLRRARRSGSASAEVRLRGRDGREVPVAVSVSAIEDADGQRAGAVMTIEDLSELIMAERAAAWSEVARRMAHEIKNPLTPIQISAERIARNFTRKDRSSEHLQRVIAECTATIVREVGSLQRMVEEFSKFARLPQPKFAPTDLNGVVATTASLYEERLDGASLELRLAERLPALMLDAEQIKRVIVNLVDNALEAVREAAERRITVETSHDRSRDIVRLVVSDTGHGLDGADVTRLFLPYFSTRSRGTGLGLAIVSHIVSEHHGAVRAEGNEPCGARFIVEFPAGEVEPAVQERPELVGRAS